MPFDYDKDLDEMIKCQLCLVWYHGNCVNVDVTKCVKSVGNAEYMRDDIFVFFIFFLITY